MSECVSGWLAEKRRRDAHLEIGGKLDVAAFRMEGIVCGFDMIPAGHGWLSGSIKGGRMEENQALELFGTGMGSWVKGRGDGGDVKI